MGNPIILFVTLITTMILCVDGQGQQCGPPPALSKKPEQCCKTPSIFPGSVTDPCSKKISEDFNKIAASSPPGLQMGRTKCYFECIFKQSGIIENNGMINDANLRSKFTAAFRFDNNLLRIMNNAIDSCPNKVKVKAVNLDKTPPANGIPKCTAMPMLITMCVNSQILSSCPNDRMGPSEDCIKMKEYVTKCPF